MADTLETYRTVTPYLVVPDADRQVEFLAAAFGGSETLSLRDGGRVRHAEVKIGDSLVMLGEAGEQWKALKAALYLWVADVDAVYGKAISAGATSVSAPEDKPYGHRTAGVLDPNGNTWWIGSPVR